MDSSLWLIQSTWDGPFYIFRGPGYKFLIKLYFFRLVANSVDPDEMWHYSTFHLGLHYLPTFMYALRSHCYEKS